MPHSQTHLVKSEEWNISDCSCRVHPINSNHSQQHCWQQDNPIPVRHTHWPIRGVVWCELLLNNIYAAYSVAIIERIWTKALPQSRLDATSTPHVKIAIAMVIANHVTKISCEHCCSPINRRWSQQEMHRWTGVTVIRSNVPTQWIVSIHNNYYGKDWSCMHDSG